VVHLTFDMTTINMNNKARFVTIMSAAKVRFGRSQPRWVVLLTGGLALAILVRITVTVGQLFGILNALYAAGLT
jgi:hypothetical protein